MLFSHCFHAEMDCGGECLISCTLKSLLSEVLQCECVAWAVYLGSLFALEIICSVAAMQIFSFVVS